jgi:hypothetical protein
MLIGNWLKHVSPTPKKSQRLFGLPRLRFEHVLEAFTSQGFKQSIINPCFLFKDTIMIVMPLF